MKKAIDALCHPKVAFMLSVVAILAGAFLHNQDLVVTGTFMALTAVIWALMTE